MEKRLFFRVATAGLGKYHTGGYSRIGVYRVKGIFPHFCTTLLTVLFATGRTESAATLGGDIKIQVAELRLFAAVCKRLQFTFSF